MSLTDRLEARVTAAVVARLLHVIEPRLAALDRTVTDVAGLVALVTALASRVAALERAASRRKDSSHGE